MGAQNMFSPRGGMMPPQGIPPMMGRPMGPFGQQQLPPAMPPQGMPPQMLPQMPQQMPPQMGLPQGILQGQPMTGPQPNSPEMLARGLMQRGLGPQR